MIELQWSMIGQCSWQITEMEKPACEKAESFYYLVVNVAKDQTVRAARPFPHLGENMFYSTGFDQLPLRHLNHKEPFAKVLGLLWPHVFCHTDHSKK